ncbi:MAG TPA: NAD(P)H-dependent oxidoreductase subunit E [candidate division Zixibacteria bacterium]|mgnify:CR=1 FL=1|nr:NAD(P)H-dependent oxidoreductase subunit E [candidate division Zixibacteria bacterium]
MPGSSTLDRVSSTGQAQSIDWSAVDREIARFSGRPGSLIPTLEAVQNIVGYLPAEVQRRVARGLGLPLSKVYGVVTFYSFFTMEPRGKYQILVCQGTACHVRGGAQIMSELQKKLKIGLNQCTDDRLFSLHSVRCLGACGLAPVVMIGKDIHQQVKVARLDSILKSYGWQR